MPNRLALAFVLMTVFIDSVGVGIIFPVMPDLLKEVLGTDLSHAAVWGGVLAASFGAMQFLFGPVLGNLSDRYGRRPVLLISLAVMAVDYLAMAVAHTVWLLLAARLVAGIAAATQPTATAFMADISRPGERAKNFGLIGAALGLGFAVGPLIGGLIAEFGSRAPFWVAAAIAGANLVFGMAVMPETVTDRIRRPFAWARANPFASFRAIGTLPGTGRLLAVHFAYMVAMFVYPAVWAFYCEARFGWEAWMVGVTLTLFGVCIAASQAFAVGPAIRWLGERGTVMLGFGFDLIGVLAFAVLTSGTWALVFTVITGLAGVGGPALQGMLSNAVPDDQQGELQGVVGSLTAVATTLSPLVMTQIFAIYTDGDGLYAPGAPFAAAAVLMLVCGAIFVAPTRVRPQATP